MFWLVRKLSTDCSRALNPSQYSLRQRTVQLLYQNDKTYDVNKYIFVFVNSHALWREQRAAREPRMLVTHGPLRCFPYTHWTVRCTFWDTERPRVSRLRKNSALSLPPHPRTVVHVSARTTREGVCVSNALESLTRRVRVRTSESADFVAKLIINYSVQSSGLQSTSRRTREFRMMITWVPQVWTMRKIPLLKVFFFNKIHFYSEFLNS